MKDPMTTSSIVWCHSPIRAKMPAVLPVTAFCKCHPVKNASNFFVLLLLQEFGHGFPVKGLGDSQGSANRTLRTTVLEKRLVFNQ